MLARSCLLRTMARIPQSRGERYFATKPPTEAVIFPDRDMVVCWHPEQQFPYEYSKPLPAPEQAPYSVLKIDEKTAKQVFLRNKPRKEIADELAKETYTTKHRWFPRSRDKKAKTTESDRPYL